MTPEKTDSANDRMIRWTPAKLKLLKAKLALAEHKGEEAVDIDGHNILVAYGNYLADYLTSEFDALNEPHGPKPKGN